MPAHASGGTTVTYDCAIYLQNFRAMPEWLQVLRCGIVLQVVSETNRNSPMIIVSSSRIIDKNMTRDRNVSVLRISTPIDQVLTRI
jgi:hypothetical protein